MDSREKSKKQREDSVSLAQTLRAIEEHKKAVDHLQQYARAPEDKLEELVCENADLREENTALQEKTLP